MSQTEKKFRIWFSDSNDRWTVGYVWAPTHKEAIKEALKEFFQPDLQITDQLWDGASVYLIINSCAYCDCGQNQEVPNVCDHYCADCEIFSCEENENYENDCQWCELTESIEIEELEDE